ncbi:MAG TPA: glycosyltransferase family 1 protein [Bryobacteraceae bacterium]|nr:glycosyltransferase family 1 protein [Bryobacteraceae bacterium]
MPVPRQAMRIALDATPLTEPTGGVRRYTEELARALSACYPNDEIWLVSDQPFESDLLQLPNVRRGLGPQSPLARKWWLWGIRRELSRIGADVFHGVDFSVPYLPLRPSVMTVHDLSPWREESMGAASHRVRRRTPFLIGLGAATMVITPTRAIREEVIARFRVHPDRTAAVPLAAPERFKSVAALPHGEPFFLYVGTIEPRKNIAVLIDAWRELRRREKVDLWLAGRVRNGFEAPRYEPGLRMLGAVEDEMLPQLYSRALAFVYPSAYEGFGLPVLEAMQCGAMVIASRDPAICEVAGGAAVQVDAGDAAGWAQAMRAALDEEARRRWRERSLERAAHFSWEQTARRTHEVYEEARRRF